jgi:hypothetical protein
MPAKNSRRLRQSQAKATQRLLTFQQAQEHPLVKLAVVPLRKAWQKRQHARLWEFKKDAATNPESYWKAVDVEFATKDPEPSARAVLAGKLRTGMPFFVQDAVRNVVKGDHRDVGALLDRMKYDRHCELFIDVEHLRKAFHGTKSSRRTSGRPPEVRERVAAAMRDGLRDKTLTAEQLKNLKPLSGAKKYRCGREAFVAARDIVLPEIELPTITDTN